MILYAKTDNLYIFVTMKANPFFVVCILDLDSYNYFNIYF